MTALSSWNWMEQQPRFHVLHSNLWEGGDAWAQFLAKLQQWSVDPAGVGDEDVEPPTRDTIRVAAGLAMRSRDHRLPAPTRVMPNGEAGVVFEWVDGDRVYTWELDRDLRLEISHHLAGWRQSRTAIDLSSAPSGR